GRYRRPGRAAPVPRGSLLLERDGEPHAVLAEICLRAARRHLALQTGRQGVPGLRDGERGLVPVVTEIASVLGGGHLHVEDPQGQPPTDNGHDGSSRDPDRGSSAPSPGPVSSPVWIIPSVMRNMPGNRFSQPAFAAGRNCRAFASISATLGTRAWRQA